VHGKHAVRQRRRPGFRRPAAVLLYLIVLVVFGGGAVAYASFDKTVHVTVDGKQRTVHTFARTVGGVLDSAHLRVGEHDDVLPQQSAHIANGAHIDVEHGRQLNLVVDGKQVVVWVTARTVKQALQELGISDRGAFVSASVSQPVPLTGLGLVVRMPHRLTILHDGVGTRLTTNVATVRAAIAAAHLRVGPHDRVSVPLRSMPTSDEVITITRVSTSHLTLTLAIPFHTEQVADSSIYKGTTHVVNSGRVGVRVQKFDYIKINGTVRHRILVSDHVVRSPTTRVVHYGTKPKPTYGSYVGGGVDELNWYALAGCESNHNPQAYSSRGPYYGLYQFLMSSWQAVGGQGDPRNSSVDEQTYRAKLLYKRYGNDSPWPECGHHLYDK
jgi:uncharacterized protein YabE (DUF348 family)